MDKTNLLLKSGETTVVQEKNKPQEIKPLCDIKALQLATLSAHNPTNREKEFFKWLQRNGSVCSVLFASALERIALYHMF